MTAAEQIVEIVRQLVRLDPVREALRDVVRAEIEARESSRGEQLLTVQAFAAARSISTSTVRAAIRAGRLPAIRIGRAVRVPADAVIATATRAPAASSASIAVDRARAALGIVRGGRP